MVDNETANVFLLKGVEIEIERMGSTVNSRMMFFRKGKESLKEIEIISVPEGQKFYQILSNNIMVQ